MTQRLNPYLLFTGQAREALAFYAAALGGEVRINTFGELGGSDDPATKDWVMHGQLETPAGFVVMAGDVPPGMGYEISTGSNMSISLSGTDEALRGYFEKLAEDGKVTTPLAKQMWGDEYGDLVDKFGVRWLVDIGPMA